MIATLQENPTQLERIVRGFGWSLADDHVTLMHRSPVDLYVDEWMYDLLDTVIEVGATRVLVDSLGDLQAASSDATRFREYVHSMLSHFSSQGVSVMMTHEIPELYGVTSLTEYGASHLADNVVILQYRKRHESAIARTLAVLKTRASSHDPHLREFDITSAGITLSRQPDD